MGGDGFCFHAKIFNDYLILVFALNDFASYEAKIAKNQELLDIQAYNSAYKAFCRILKRWFISWNTDQIADFCYFYLITSKYP